MLLCKVNITGASQNKSTAGLHLQAREKTMGSSRR